MQEVIIKNFGPVESFRMGIKEFLVLIGPQASGKSTIAKSIYFFKSLRDDLIRYIYDSIQQKNFNKPLGTYAKLIRKKFLDFWGPTQHLDNIFLECHYKKDVSITITLEENGKYVSPTFSSKLKEGALEIIDEAQNFIAETEKRDPAFLSSSDLLAIESGKRAFFKRTEEKANQLFDDHTDLIYIPAGRSLLATLSDHLPMIHPHHLDYLMKAFLDRINNSKPLFNKSLADIIMEKKKLTQDFIDNESVTMAQKIIEGILKASYRFDRSGEKLYLDEYKYTKLNYSSSGQQEAIWILLLLFLLILENKKVFVVIEEPEAHLYPEAQKEMVDLIALLANREGNQVIITTHSPYILTSINNLLYAKKVGGKSPGAVSQKIHPKLWLDKTKLDAFFIDKGSAASILDKELELLQPEAIDSASKIINDDYDFLFNLDE